MLRKIAIHTFPTLFFFIFGLITPDLSSKIILISVGVIFFASQIWAFAYEAYYKSSLIGVSLEKRQRIQNGIEHVLCLMRVKSFQIGCIDASTPCLLDFRDKNTVLRMEDFTEIDSDHDWEKTYQDCVAQTGKKHKLGFFQRRLLQNNMRAHLSYNLPALSAHEMMQAQGKAS